MRFRKTLTLAPGLKMNFTGRGVSWTLGPRGASIGVGRGGTYANVGIPGSGLSWREKIGRRSLEPNSSPTSPPDEGGLAGESMTGFVANKEDREVREALIRDIHLSTPDYRHRPAYTPVAFDEPQPTRPVPRRPGLLDFLVPKRRSQLAADNLEAETSFQEALRNWKRKKEEFDAREARHQQLVERDIYMYTDAMGKYLQERLGGISWPRETNLSWDILEDGLSAYVDVDMPEIEDLPHTKVLASSQREKQMSSTEVRKLYVHHVHAVGFRIIGEIFAALPAVDLLILSAFSQRPDPATGHVRDDYLYSVRVRRDQWAKICFANLQNINVVEALGQFDLRRDMTKSGILKPIEPFSPDSGDAADTTAQPGRQI